MMSLNKPQLPFAVYRFRFKALEPVRLPDYSGSAWRGVFGNSLKRLVCVTRDPQCEHCLLYRSCIYPYIFETPPDPGVGKMRKYNAAPHPFVLYPGATMSGQLAADTEHELDVTLFGHGNRQLPYIIHALDRAAQRGIGKQRGKLGLLEVRQRVQEDWVSIYEPDASLRPVPPLTPELPDCPAQLTLRFVAPFRMKVEDRLVTPESFAFKRLFSALLRRISLLTAFHTDTPLETDFADLTRSAGAIAVAQHTLRWHEWTRYSSRQDSLMQLGGLLGEITIEDCDLTRFWPYIWLGQWTHAGKSTSMGLGKYEVIETGQVGAVHAC